MKNACLTAVLVILLAPPLRAAEKVAFAYKAPAVGLTQTSTQVETTKMMIRVLRDGKVAQTQNQDIVKNITVETTTLEIQGGSVFKKKVAYPTSIQTQNSKGTAQKIPDPIHGKTYVVEKTDAGSFVTYADGKAPPASEVSLIKDKHKYIGTIPPMAAYLNGKSFELGQAVPVPDETVKKMFGGRAGLNVQRFVMTLQKTTSVNDVKVGIFDVALTLVDTTNPGMSLTMNIKGQYTVGIATCRQLGATMSGTMVMKGKTRGLDVDGTGSMSYHETKMPKP